MEEHEALLAEQDGLCAICESAPAIHTDHDHATNEVRGILCGPCNLGLGQFRDDARLLTAAASYLRRHRQAKGRELVIDLIPYLGESPIEVSLRKHLA